MLELEDSYHILALILASDALVSIVIIIDFDLLDKNSNAHM